MDLLLEATRRVQDKHFWFRALRRFLPPMLQRAVAGAPNPRLLDCGAGTGVNLALLSSFGRVCAVDFNQYGLHLARQAGFSATARATVAALPFPDASFDVTSSIDVLYCLDDDAEHRAVKEMFRVLRPGGAAVINVAAMPILHGDHSVLAGEVRRYDRPRLRRLLEDAGFRIERLSYTNASTFPLMLAQRTLERLGGLSSPDRAAGKLTVPPRPINDALSAVLAIEAMVVRGVSLPFGSSLLALARKPGPRRV